MNPSTKRGHVATARTAGRDASSTRPPKALSASLSPMTMASYAKASFPAGLDLMKREAGRSDLPRSRPMGSRTASVTQPPAKAS